MKRNVMLVFALFVLVLFGLGAATLSWYGIIEYDPTTGKVTINKPAVFTGSVAIESTTPSTIPSLESGTSLYQINGNTVLAATQLNRIYYVAPAATSRIVQVATPSSVNQEAYFIDGTRPSGISGGLSGGNSGGVSLFCIGVSIWSGGGSAYRGGTTVFVNSGSTGYTVALKAVIDPVTGALAWRVMPTDTTVNSVP